MSLITHLTSSAQLSTLLKTRGEKLVVIDFHASWCGPCHAIAPKYEAWSKQYKGATFTKCDVDAAQDIAKQYNVTAMPTFVFIKGGKEIERVRGGNVGAIEAALQKYAGGAGAAGGTFPGKGFTLGSDETPSVAVGAPSEGGSSQTTMIILGALFVVWYFFYARAAGGDDVAKHI